MIELDKFSATFRDFSDDYCVIGGGAMLEIAKNYSLQPRATKDIDIIVFVKASTPSFIRKLALFAQEAAYRECSHSENFCSYRFSHPKDKTYPDQIELFCFDPVLGNELQRHLVHSTLGQGVSFSAILLDKDYYDFAQQHVLKSEISYLSEEAMIPLKAKAYLANKELWEEHADGASSANYRKHGRDLIRLSLLLNNAHTLALPRKIYQDLDHALLRLREEGFDCSEIAGVSSFALIESAIRNHYTEAKV